MRRRIGLVMAMEEELAQVDTLAEVDNEGSAETAMLEATDMGAEVDYQMDDIDTVADSSDELCKIADVMEKTTENGGMDEQTAEVVEVAVEGIYARMGVKRFAKMPAMESFVQKTSRLQATKIALEDVKGFIANAWKKIIEAIAAASEFVMSFLKKIFDVNARMKDRAQAYKTKLATLSSSEAKEKTIACGSFGKSLALSPEAGSFATDVAKGLGNLVNAMKVTATRAETASSNSSIPSGGNNALVSLDLDMGNKVGAAQGFDEPAEGMTVTRTDELPGGRAFVSEYIQTSFKGDMNPAMIRDIKVYVGEFNPKKPVEFKSETVATANAADMTKTVDAVLALSIFVEQGKAVSDKLYNARKALIASAKAYVDKKEEDTKMKDQQAFATMYNKLTKNFMTDFNKFAVSTGLQALNYVQKSMEQYEAKAPAEKAAA